MLHRTPPKFSGELIRMEIVVSVLDEGRITRLDINTSEADFTFHLDGSLTIKPKDSAWVETLEVADDGEAPERIELSDLPPEAQEQWNRIFEIVNKRDASCEAARASAKGKRPKPLRRAVCFP